MSPSPSVTANLWHGSKNGLLGLHWHDKTSHQMMMTWSPKGFRLGSFEALESQQFQPVGMSVKGSAIDLQRKDCASRSDVEFQIIFRRPELNFAIFKEAGSLLGVSLRGIVVQVRAVREEFRIIFRKFLDRKSPIIFRNLREVTKREGV
jgi:hypothetical protein